MPIDAAAEKAEKDPDNIDVIAGGVDVDSVTGGDGPGGEKEKKIKVTQVVVGYAHMLALTVEGVVYSWGCNSHGQLGLGDHKDRASPSLVSYLSEEERVVAVAAGHLHSFAVTEMGELYSWGYNRDYQLGLGDILDRVLPTRVGGALEGARVTSVAGGGFHSLAVTSKGEVFSFGHNRWGQAGVDPKAGETPGGEGGEGVEGVEGIDGGEEDERGGRQREGDHDIRRAHNNNNLANVASGGVGVTTPTRVLLLQPHPSGGSSSSANTASQAVAAVAAGTW